MSDLWTMIWKEWHELFARQGRFRGGAMNFVLVVAVFGIMMPWQFGRAWVESPLMLAYWGWVPLLLLSNVVVDAFAGERERHTLETLLASRLPDRAILFGKLATAMGYGLAVTAASLVLGLLTVNLVVRGDRLLLYPAGTLAGALLASLLGSALIAGVGVLVSLRAASVRQAGQLVGVVVLLVAFVPLIVVRWMSTHWLHLGPLSPASASMVGFAVIGAVLALDLVFMGAAMSRFRRSRLLLD